jgi:hypothetical protein
MRNSGVSRDSEWLHVITVHDGKIAHGMATTNRDAGGGVSRGATAKRAATADRGGQARCGARTTLRRERLDAQPACGRPSSCFHEVMPAGCSN